MKIEKWMTFYQSDINSYNKLVGDTNPLHFDEEFCSGTIFEAPIVPGLLSSGLFGGLLGSNLPDGAILLGMKLKFIAPIYIEERVLATIYLESHREDKPIATYKLVCFKADGEIAIDGEAIVKI